MKLHYASASPFVRKVMVSAIELELDVHLALEPAANPTLPTVRNPAIAADNPLSKVPTLVLADGERLYELDCDLRIFRCRGRTEQIIP